MNKHFKEDKDAASKAGQKSSRKGIPNRTNNVYKELYQNIIGSFKNGCFYVYYHINKNTGEIVYLYIKHTGTTDGSTATTILVDVEDTNNEAFARLGANEFLFLPYRNITRNTGVQFQAASGTVQMEYAFFTKV